MKGQGQGTKGRWDEGVVNNCRWRGSGFLAGDLPNRQTEGGRESRHRRACRTTRRSVEPLAWHYNAA
jgi:hypothetical protein